MFMAKPPEPERAPMSETVAAQRDQWKGEAQTAWQTIAELRHGLTELLAVYVSERNLVHASVTDAVGAFTSEKGQRVVAEMDLFIGRARALLARSKR